jgi:hypothetical protein
VIFTGECQVSPFARLALDRAAQRAKAEGRDFATQEDLLLALVEVPDPEMAEAIEWLGDAYELIESLSHGRKPDVLLTGDEPSAAAESPLQKSIELSICEGMIDGPSLLTGLLRFPTTPLLKQISRKAPPLLS